MKIYPGFESVGRDFPACVLTIGNFDGVHLGHVEIIKRTLNKAKELGKPCGIYTFRPHPRVVLQPGAHIQFLTTYDEKIERIAHYQPDFLIEEPFSREFSSRSAEEFFKHVLVERLNVSYLIVGHDFGFGKDRKGVLERLQDFCTNSSVGLEIIHPYSRGETIISSTKIRELLANHEIREANSLLGYSFFYEGVVERGDQRGKGLGFPTANIGISDKVELPKGVYATRTSVDGGLFKSVTNVGTRPTFQEGKADLAHLVVENHIFDELFSSKNIYGHTIRVNFEKFLREEQKFDSAEDLVRQIHEDIALADQTLSN